MLDGLRNIFAPTFVPYADPKATIPLGAVLKNDGSNFGTSQRSS
jgi:hypothetical protein